MFSRLVKFRKGEDYEDLDGEKIDMDITDPAMRQFAGIDQTGATGGAGCGYNGEAGEVQLHQRKTVGSHECNDGKMLFYSFNLLC